MIAIIENIEKEDGLLDMLDIWKKSDKYTKPHMEGFVRGLDGREYPKGYSFVRESAALSRHRWCENNTNLIEIEFYMDIIVKIIFIVHKRKDMKDFLSYYDLGEYDIKYINIRRKDLHD